MPQLPYVEIARIEEHGQALGTAEDAAESEPIAGGFMVYGGPRSWANLARGLALQAPISDADLDRLVAFYRTRGEPPQVDVCPFADDTLVRGLSARGFTIQYFVNVLARDLEDRNGGQEDLRTSISHSDTDNIEILPVDPTNPEMVSTYIEVSTSGFRRENEPVAPAIADGIRRMLALPHCDAYLALVGGEPAGGGAMKSHGPGAGLYGTSVLPRYRRRGLQQLLISRRLERARERGCRLACIQCKPGIPTERNAARLGFFMAYTKAMLSAAPR